MNHDTYVAPNGVKIRVLNKNMLVLVDPAPEMTAGGIIIPDTAHADHYATGTVVAVGTIPTVIRDSEGEIVSCGTTPIPGIAVGDHVLFIKFLSDQDSNKMVRELLGDNLIKMQPSDVLVIFDDEDRKRVQP